MRHGASPTVVTSPISPSRHITHDRGDPRERCTAKRATIRTKERTRPLQAALAPTGRPPHKNFPTHHNPERNKTKNQLMRVFFYQAQARRDDATSGLPTAFPSHGVAARGVYDTTAAAPGFGTPGPPCPFRPTRRVTGNLNSKEEKLARVTRSFLREREVASTKKKKYRSTRRPWPSRDLTRPPTKSSAPNASKRSRSLVAIKGKGASVTGFHRRNHSPPASSSAVHGKHPRPYDASGPDRSLRIRCCKRAHG